MRGLAKLIAGWCCIWLAGCAAPGPTTGLATEAPSAIIAAPVPALARLPAATIDLAGRLSVRYQKDAHDEALHGSFTWSQHAEATVVSLLSPLGQTLAVITISPTSAAIEQAGQPTRTAVEPDALAADVLGWPLPIAGLRDWLQGFSTNAQGRRNAVTFNDTTAFRTDDGWTLQYAVWDNTDPAHPHPKRIDLTRQTGAAGEVAIRLVIDKWQPIQ